MAILNPKRFSQPGALSKIRRESLLQWLAPSRDYFAAQGIILPNNANNGALDFETLAAAFINPEPDMPEYLVESLEIINEMADEHGMDAILEAAAQRNVKLALPDFCTPADIALEAWLQARELLEEIHLEHQLTRPRSFVHFACVEENPPVITMPSAEQLQAIEARLDAWYSSKQRGRGCRVQAFPNGQECKFLVRHGDPCKREAAIKDGESTSIFYRPEKYDVVAYDWKQGELRIHCSGTKEVHELRKAFPFHICFKHHFEHVTFAVLTLLLAQRRHVHTHRLAREFRARLEV